MSTAATTTTMKPRNLTAGMTIARLNVSDWEPCADTGAPHALLTEGKVQARRAAEGDTWTVTKVEAVRSRYRGCVLVTLTMEDGFRLTLTSRQNVTVVA